MTAKAEFFAGPLDGDKLPVPEGEEVLHFASRADLTKVHCYRRVGFGFRWQGLTERADAPRVFSLAIGERRQ